MKKRRYLIKLSIVEQTFEADCNGQTGEWKDSRIITDCILRRVKDKIKAIDLFFLIKVNILKKISKKI